MNRGDKRREIMDSFSEYANDVNITEDSMCATLTRFIDDIERILGDAIY